ncbi:MAG TPA: sugar phosphate isomerase/epimerase family protein [Trueperaceae bacterium]|nr:sugar phosphate isomerase/epimerase family protein [Trueperaceae bacterium]
MATGMNTVPGDSRRGGDSAAAGSGPRFGANTFIWRSPFTTASDLDLVGHAAELGAEVLEVAVEELDLVDGAALRAELDRHGIGAAVCGAFGPGRDVGSADRAVAESTKAYVVGLMDLAVTLGARVICGPIYGSVGLARRLPPDERSAEFDRVAASLRELAQEATGRGVVLALEVLNRFETDRLNTVEQGLKLCDAVGSDAVGLHLDTFHMHLEEKDSPDAVRRAGQRLYHLHASENDRGVPGTGQVAWRSIMAVLADGAYAGDIIIESFTPEVESIAAAVALWREVAPDQDSIVRDGLRFLRGAWAAGGG